MQDSDMTSRQVAEKLGVSHEQFSKFWQVCSKFPGSFPEPKRIIGRSLIWDAPEIEAWATQAVTVAPDSQN